MGLRELAQRLDGGLLQHPLQLVGPLVGGDEDAVMACRLGIEPQAVADHVGLGDGLERLRGADEHVATDDHRVERTGRLGHDALIERHLQRQQVLGEPLSPFPAKDGDRGEHLARRGIGGQASALSARMEQQPLVGGQPFVERPASTLRLPRRAQQPVRAATRAQLVANGVVGAKPFLMVKPRDLVEAVHEIGGKGEEFLHCLCSVLVVG